MAHTLEDLNRVLTALAERVYRLEAERGLPQSDSMPAPVLDEEQFWALNGLRSRRSDDPSTHEGAVMIVGDLTLPNGAPVAWQQSAATSGLLETDWSDHAATFTALGHPVRLELLRHIICGVHTTAELAEISSLGTTGQLHHHLRQLVTAGWVRQSGRGSYDIPAARVVPLLACLTGAER